jgi:hypothetical protein
VEEELGRQKIVFMEGNDQLRWGQKDGGEFNLKEAQHYIADQDQEDLTQQWDKLWKQRTISLMNAPTQQKSGTGR